MAPAQECPAGNRVIQTAAAVTALVFATMKVVILAGGRGQRLGPLTSKLPKALVEIGGRPVLWHIMRHYKHFGFDDFVIATGEQEAAIHEWCDNSIESAHVEVVDTGDDTGSGGRVKRLAPHLGTGSFMLTWCDAVSNVDLGALLRFHRANGRLATLTAVHPPPRFGDLLLDGERVVSFAEKQPVRDAWINGAYFVLEPEVLEYIDSDRSMFEEQPIQSLVQRDQLAAFRHESFWQCMDYPSEHELLERLWASGRAPWKLWED